MDSKTRDLFPEFPVAPKREVTRRTPDPNPSVRCCRRCLSRDLKFPLDDVPHCGMCGQEGYTIRMKADEWIAAITRREPKR